MRVRQRIIAALLILAMGTMNVGTLSVYAAETENQNVIKEEKTKPESEEKDEEKPVQKTEADESTVDGSIEGGSMVDEPVVDEPTEDESTTDEATGENPETIPEEKTTEIAPERQGEKQDDKKEVELASGVYKIQLEANKNYVLDVAGGSTANEANIQIYANNETDAQKWYITKAEDGWYRIKNMQSGNCFPANLKKQKLVKILTRISNRNHLVNDTSFMRREVEAVTLPRRVELYWMYQQEELQIHPMCNSMD